MFTALTVPCTWLVTVIAWPLAPVPVTAMV